MGWDIDGSGTGGNKQESDSPCLHTDNAQETVYLCPYCTSSYPAKEPLQTHLITKHAAAMFGEADVIETLIKVSNRVEYLLRHSQDCRDSDVQLIIEYMKRWAIKQDGEPLFKQEGGSEQICASGTKIEWENLFGVYESIRRIRERIQNPEIEKKWNGELFDSELMPSEEVELKRRIRARKIRNVMVQTSLTHASPSGTKRMTTDTGAADAALYAFGKEIL